MTATPEERGGRLTFVHRYEAEPMVVCPSCGDRLPGHRVREAWIEVPLDAGWVAAYRIVPKAGRPVLAEARVFPDEEARHAGRWSGRGPAVPTGGLPGRVLGRLRLKDATKLFPEIVKRWDGLAGGSLRSGLLRRFGLRGTPELTTRRPGRRGHPDLFYAIWASAYVDRVASGSRRPIEDLVDEPPLAVEGYVSSGERVSARTIRSILREARRRKLLGSAPSGRAGGELTSEARRLLGTAPGVEG